MWDTVCFLSANSLSFPHEPNFHQITSKRRCTFYFKSVYSFCFNYFQCFMYANTSNHKIKWPSVYCEQQITVVTLHRVQEISTYLNFWVDDLNPPMKDFFLLKEVKRGSLIESISQRLSDSGQWVGSYLMISGLFNRMKTAKQTRTAKIRTPNTDPAMTPTGSKIIVTLNTTCRVKFVRINRKTAFYSRMLTLTHPVDQWDIEKHTVYNS